MFVPKLWVCLKEGYSRRQFVADAQAGFIVGLVALPLAMAFAIASGLPPERGLFTAIVAGFLISALGGSRVQIGGPTGAFVVVVAGIVSQHGYSGLVTATLMAGVILILMGITRLGALVKFIPHPVTTGFTSGIAVVIFSGQIKDFFGLPLASVPVDFLSKWHAYTVVFPQFNPWAAAVASATVLCIVGWPRAWRQIPAPIAALLLLSGVAWMAHLPVETIGSRFGNIPRTLPAPAWPDFSWAQAKQLFPAATTVALLGAIESLLSAVVADGMIGSRHKSNLELVAQGIANLASPLFGGMPATGAIARTATNVNNGGRTPVAGIMHAVTLILILAVAGRQAAHVPLAVLSGILMVVCWHMAEWRSFRLHLLGPASDRVVLLTTFMLTVLVDLTVAVEVGMVLAAFLFMKSMAELTEVRSIQSELRDSDAEKIRPAGVPLDVEVFSLSGAFFFAAAHKLDEVERSLVRAPRTLILDMTEVSHMDGSGLHTLLNLKHRCAGRNIRLILAGVQQQPRRLMDEAVGARFDSKDLAPSLTTALAWVKTGHADSASMELPL